MREIGFGNDHMPSFGRDLHPFYLSAEQPCPKCVRQFVAEHVKPHWLRQQQENDNPARSPGEKWNPCRVCAAAGLQHFEQCHPCAAANWQQQDGDDKFNPLRHGGRIQNSEFRSQQKEAAVSSMWLESIGAWCQHYSNHA